MKTRPIMIHVEMITDAPLAEIVAATRRAFATQLLNPNFSVEVAQITAQRIQQPKRPSTDNAEYTV